MKKPLLILFYMTFLSSMALAASPLPDFFLKEKLSQFTLKAPFKEIATAQKNASNFLELKKLKFEGSISYQQGNQIVEIPASISIKGFTTAMLCKFPKLELKLKDSSNTVFRGIKKIDLNTHCDDSPAADHTNYFIRSMTYNHREVVAYRILEVFQLKTFATKPVQMSYWDTSTQSKPEAAPKNQYFAFFIEDKSDYIKRNELNEIKGPNDTFKEIDLAEGKTQEAQYQFLSVKDNKSKIDFLELCKIEIFQNLIMNSDWFIKQDPNDFRHPDNRHELWNMKLFEDLKERKWSFLAQDFNFSILASIHGTPEGIYFADLDFKFVNQLSKEERWDLANFIEQQKMPIMSQVDLVKSDASFEKIKNFLDKRIERIISTLRK